MLIPMAAAGLRSNVAGGVSYVGKGTYSAAANPVVIDLDAGHSTGDLLIISLSLGDDATAVTTPTGWTLVGDASSGVGSDNKGAAYWRITDGTEAASVSFTLSGGVPASGICFAYSGVASVDDTDANWYRSDTTPAWTGTAPTLVAGDAIAVFISAATNSTPGLWTQSLDDGDYTIIHDQLGSDRTSKQHAVAHNLTPSAGTPTPPNWASSNGTAKGLAVLRAA